MDTDVTALRIAGVAAGLLYTGSLRLKGLVFCGTGAGQLELRDGLTGAGTVLLTLDIVAGTGSVLLPGGGIRFRTGLFATTTGLFVSANMFVG